MDAKISILAIFYLGVVLVRDTVCFFENVYIKWLVVLPEYTTVPSK